MRALAASVAFALAINCTHAAPHVVTSLPATSASITPSGTSTPRAAGLAACPAPRPFSAVPVFARGLGAPDDLLVLSDRTVWVSDPLHGTLRHLSTGGRVLQTIDDPEAPEGMVVLPDGRMIVAEQRQNRLVAFRPPDTRRTTVLTLPTQGTGLGVDGIKYDPKGARILIPDSPHGTLLAWPVAGGRATVLARDLGRAVDAAIGPDGATYVTAEATAGLLRISGGRAEPLGHIVQADDVVSAGGLLYVTLIDSGEVVAVDPSTGSHRALVSGIGAAQGLAVLADGRLAIADSNRGTIAIVAACG
jgi:streptogramin lyase